MTKLVPFDPFAELQQLQRQFLGDDDWLSAPVQMHALPITDVFTEDDKQLIVETHLPNFNEKDIEAFVDGDVLVVRGERHDQEKDKAKKYVVRESSSSFYRRIRLPELANKDAVEAHMKDGVLKVIVPLRELPAPKKIEVNVSKK